MEGTSPITFKTGASVGNIIANNELIANTPPPVETPPAIIPPTIAETPVTTPETTTVPVPEVPVVTPEVEAEKNKSVINFDEFEEKPSPSETTTVTDIPPATRSWKDEIKKADIKEVLKELGVDEFAIELTEYRKNGGDPADYLQAKFIDYNKITDESLVKADLQKQYPTFTPQQIDLMFARKYSVPEDADQQDKDFAELQLKADAHTSRQSKIAEQQKFKIPAAIQPSDNSEQSQIEAEQLRQEAKKWFSEHEATKTLTTTKRVSLSLGENGTFNFEVSNPDFVTRAITENDVWQKLTATKTGEPDVSKLQKLVLYAANPDKFENDLVNYGKTLALPTVVDEGRNITPPHKVIPMTPENAGKPQGYKTSKVGG